MTWREDRTLIVLIGGLLFFTAMVMIVVYAKGDDVQLYALFSGVFGQFSGALMMHLKGEKAAPAGSVIDTQVHQRTEIPPVPDTGKTPQEPTHG